jgi:hypothetical protein
MVAISSHGIQLSDPPPVQDHTRIMHWQSLLVGGQGTQHIPGGQDVVPLEDPDPDPEEPLELEDEDDDPLDPLDDDELPELPELPDDDDELELLEELDDDELLDEQTQVPNRNGSQALSSANRLTTAQVPAGM